MKKYAVQATHIADDFFWNVYEKKTDQVIRTFYFEEDALDMARFMEKGGAFDGYTPAFILSSVQLPGEDVNEKFTRTFSI